MRCAVSKRRPGHSGPRRSAALRGLARRRRASHPSTEGPHVQPEPSGRPRSGPLSEVLLKSIQFVVVTEIQDDPHTRNLGQNTDYRIQIKGNLQNGLRLGSLADADALEHRLSSRSALAAHAAALNHRSEFFTPAIDRSASFTAFDVGKSFATSGSSRTTAPCSDRTRLCLPRLPYRKSYSSLGSSSGFFVVMDLRDSRPPCEDDSDRTPSLGIADHERSARTRHADAHEALLGGRHRCLSAAYPLLRLVRWPAASHASAGGQAYVRGGASYEPGRTSG